MALSSAAPAIMDGMSCRSYERSVKIINWPAFHVLCCGRSVTLAKLLEVL